jgi:hypothetical protein
MKCMILRVLSIKFWPLFVRIFCGKNRTHPWDKLSKTRCGNTTNSSLLWWLASHRSETLPICIFVLLVVLYSCVVSLANNAYKQQRVSLQWVGSERYWLYSLYIHLPVSTNYLFIGLQIRILILNFVILLIFFSVKNYFLTVMANALLNNNSSFFSYLFTEFFSDFKSNK